MRPDISTRRARPWDIRDRVRLLVMLLLVAALCAGAGRRSARAQQGLRLPVDYPAGWNLVGGPDGTVLSGANDPIYTADPAEADYRALAAGTKLEAGRGYWAYFPAAARVQLPAENPGSRSFALPAGRFVLVGNPLPVLVAVAGADVVYSYDPLQGYHETSTLQPGQGGWALSLQGSTAVVGALAGATPEDAQIAERLSPLLFQSTDLPADLAALQPLETRPLSNAEYARLRPGAIEIQARLDLLGRKGGVFATWQAEVDPGPSLHTPYGLSNAISLFDSADGARGGLDLILSRVAVAPSQGCTGPVPLTPAPATVGDESSAQRIDCTFDQALSQNLANTVRLHVTYAVLAWRHGNLLSTIRISTIDEEPLLDDLAQLARLQDARFTAAGY